MAGEARELSAELGVGLAFIFAVLATAVESILALSLERYFSDRIAEETKRPFLSRTYEESDSDGGRLRKPLIPAAAQARNANLFTLNRLGEQPKQMFRMPWHREK
jgi:hypothetical protein